MFHTSQNTFAQTLQIRKCPGKLSATILLALHLRLHAFNDIREQVLYPGMFIQVCPDVRHDDVTNITCVLYEQTAY